MNISFLAIEVTAVTLAVGASIYITNKWAGRIIAWIQQSFGTSEKVKNFSPKRNDTYNSPLDFQNHHLKDISKNNIVSPLNLVIAHEKERFEKICKSTSSYISRQTTLPSLPKKEQMEFLGEQHYSITSATKIFILPERRVCGFGCMESLQTIARAKKAIFITSEEIIQVHPMSFLTNSPFIKVKIEQNKNIYSQNSKFVILQDSLLSSQEKKEHAIAITKNCKHVILQQAVKSCVPTCVAMLLLDRGKIPNYDALKSSCLANTEQVTKWINDAQLVSRLSLVPLKNFIDFLSNCLAENGPGMLEIYHPVIAGHAVILDKISTERNEAVIRDSFHGWMVTIKLDALKSWLRPGSDFLQII